MARFSTKRRTLLLLGIVFATLAAIMLVSHTIAMHLNAEQRNPPLRLAILHSRDTCPLRYLYQS